MRKSDTPKSIARERFVNEESEKKRKKKKEEEEEGDS
jgi:hypothetical protein